MTACQRRTLLHLSDGTTLQALPPDLVARWDSIAREMNVTRELALWILFDRYLEVERHWEDFHRWGENRARDLGLIDEGASARGLPGLSA